MKNILIFENCASLLSSKLELIPIKQFDGKYNYKALYIDLCMKNVLKNIELTET